MTSWPSSSTHDVISEIRLRQSMCIYLKNKFHPSPISNNGRLMQLGNWCNRFRPIIRSVHNPELALSQSLEGTLFLVLVSGAEKLGRLPWALTSIRPYIMCKLRMNASATTRA